MTWLLHHFKMASIDRYATHNQTLSEMINSVHMNESDGPEPDTIVSSFNICISDAIETVFSHKT
jgi:hypothetical protein